MLPVRSSREEVLAMLAEYIYYTWEFWIKATRFFFSLVTFFTFSPFLLMTSLSCAIVILL